MNVFYIFVVETSFCFSVGCLLNLVALFRRTELLGNDLSCMVTSLSLSHYLYSVYGLDRDVT